MTKEEKLVLLRDRYARLSQSPKSAKSPGVVKKLARTIRNLEKTNE